MNKELETLNNKLTETVKTTNKLIETIGESSNGLNSALKGIQDCFDCIRGIPEEQQKQYLEIKNQRLTWEDGVKKILKSFDSSSMKSFGFGAAGVGAGVTIAAAGPSVAMGIATTFGVASTGTAISSLSGAAATNAALAWLGGGALAAGGAGMAGGKLLLALAGPVGIAIAIASFATSGLLFWKTLSDKKRVETILSLVTDKQIKQYKLANTEMRTRISKMLDEIKLLINASDRLKEFGLDYSQMTDAQKYELGSYVNLMRASTQLLIKPIEGLKPRFDEKDYYRVFLKEPMPVDGKYTFNENKYYEKPILYFANLFDGIDMIEKDFHLMWKLYKKNSDQLAELGLDKYNFDELILIAAYYMIINHDLHK